MEHRFKKRSKNDCVLIVEVGVFSYSLPGFIALFRVYVPHIEPISLLSQGPPGQVNMGIRPIFRATVHRKGEHLAIEVEMIRFRCFLVQPARRAHGCDELGLFQFFALSAGVNQDCFRLDDIEGFIPP